MNEAISVRDFIIKPSYNAVADMLQSITLEDFQCIDLLKCLYYKEQLISYETGMGKTVLAAAIMQALWNEDSTRRFIFMVKKDQLIQTPDKLKEYCDCVCYTSTAEREQVDSILHSGLDSGGVLLLSHECLNNVRLMFSLFQQRDKFCGIFVDEAHMLSNYETASSSSMLRSMLLHFEYRYLLTATPIVRDDLQLASLLLLLDRGLFNHPRDIKRLDCSLDTEQATRIAELLLSRDRASVGAKGQYNVHPIYINPHPHQLQKSVNVMLNCKGFGAENQVYALVELLKRLKQEGKKGLVYIQQHAVRDWVEQHLEGTSLVWACINGKVTNTDVRRTIFQAFEEGVVDFVITSVTMAIDLDSDYVIFYEFTPFIFQMIGRAHRGLTPKVLDLFFLFTKRTAEIKHFLGSTYNKSLFIRELLGRQIEEIIELCEKIQDEMY